MKGWSLMAQPNHFDPWSPPRPFPVHLWLNRRFPFRVPNPPPVPRGAAPGGEQRREFELCLLVFCLPPWLHDTLLPTLRLEVKRRFPWSQERCPFGGGRLPKPGFGTLACCAGSRARAAGSSLMALGRFPASALGSSAVAWLRSTIVSELELGLTTIQTPLAWLSRPARNHWLAMRAARLGQLADALARSPEAEPLEQEAQRVLAALRR